MSDHEIKTWLRDKIDRLRASDCTSADGHSAADVIETLIKLLDKNEINWTKGFVK